MQSTGRIQVEGTADELEHEEVELELDEVEEYILDIRKIFKHRIAAKIMELFLDNEPICPVDDELEIFVFGLEK